MVAWGSYLVAMKWSVDTAQDATDQIVQHIRELAKTKHAILLLVSGGSAIAIEAEVLAQLTNCTQIVGVLPMDERYGPKAHADSNIAQLVTHLPDSPIQIYDILDQNVPFDQTVDYYSSLAQDLFARADSVVAICGLGADAHTAGLLPGSPATNDTVSTVIGYNWQDYTRMTLGASYLLQITMAFVLAYGDSKKVALQRLQVNNESSEELPAKLLYDISDVTIYNDFITSDKEGEG